MVRRAALAIAVLFLPALPLAAEESDLAPGSEAEQADGGSAEAADAGVPDAWNMPFGVESIQAVVRSHQAEVQACYEDTLAEGQDVEGVVVIAFTVVPQGVVTHARVKSSTLHHRAVETCLVESLRHWYFPKPKRAQPVEFPFRFNEVGGKPRPAAQPAAKHPAKRKTRSAH